MSWTQISWRVIRKRENAVLSVLVLIAWSLFLTVRYWLEMEESSYNIVFVISVVLSSILTFIFIIMLYREMRKIVEEDHIETPQEIYDREYPEELTDKDPRIIELQYLIDRLGGVKFTETFGVLPKVEFAFPVEHKFDSYQKITIVLERDNKLTLNAELKHDFPFFFNIRKTKQPELSTEKSKKSKKEEDITVGPEKYIVKSDDPKFAQKILDETLVEETIALQDSNLEQITVLGRTLTATLGDINALELLFILLSTIIEKYAR